QADAESLTATYNSGRVCGVDQSLMADLIPMVYEGDPMPADFDDPHNVIAVIGSWYSREGHDDTIEQYSVGSDIVYLPDPSLVYGDKPIVFHIVGLVRAEDFAFLEISYLPTLCLPEQSLAALGLDVPLSRLFLTVDEARSDQLSVILEGLCAQDEALRFQSLVGLSQEYRSQLAGIGAFAYLILVVIALIGLVNLVASTVLSVEQRQRELGVLMAVGMSRRDVMRMLGREGVWVSLLSTALSVPLGLGLGVGLYVMLIGVGATFLQFVFPAWPLLGLIVFMGVLPYLVNRLAVSRLGRYTIVDLLGRQV
ncbi:MAG: ABC transporter permease, partial [Coriobacteriia bacterium]|nr:ABC transporter permease [Coriobacteriia bacterium]